eukprot:1569260-Prymnesium_polylepis.2
MGERMSFECDVSQDSTDDPTLLCILNCSNPASHVRILGVGLLRFHIVGARYSDSGRDSRGLNSSGMPRWPVMLVS